MMRIALVLAVMLTATPAHANTPPPPQQAPLVVTLAGPPEVRAGQTVTVQVRIERTKVDATPMQLKLDVPEGAMLVGSQKQVRIVDRKHATWQRTFKVRLQRVPERDLQAVVDVRAASYGVHATAAYRFGRPEPQLPDPPRDGKPVKIPGHDLGKGIVVP